MRFLKVLLCGGFLLGAHTLRAQEADSHHSLTLHWGVYIPSNGVFMNRVAAISPSLEWDWQVSNAFSIGTEAGYTYGSEQGYTRNIYEGDLVTGQTDRNLTLVSFTAHCHWFLGTMPHQRLRPFIGVGTGVQYAVFRIQSEMINKSTGHSIGGIVRPEAGVIFAPRRNGRVRIEIKCGWQYADNQYTPCQLPSMSTSSLEGFRVSAGIRYQF